MADVIELNEADDGMFEGVDEGETQPVVSLQSRSARLKGRGFKQGGQAKFSDDKNNGGQPGAPQRSVEGWIVCVTNVHEEAAEEDVLDKFAEYGTIKNCQLNLDRQTGYVKGYALIEYETYDEADAAVNEASGSDLLGQSVSVNFAFVRGGGGGGGGGRR